MINKEVTVSLQLADINFVISLEHEVMTLGYNKLAKGTDYEVHKGVNSLFIKVTKKLDCEKLHHLKVKVNQKPDGKDDEWITCLKLKGKIQMLNVILIIILRLVFFIQKLLKFKMQYQHKNF